MGVPGFYRWLCQRYPLIRRRLDDPSRPVFNNLFIDLNGIIYRAITATNFKGPDLTEDFLSEMYRYIDLLVQVIKPTDLIFIAVDGVAPFAKATQQRERRFVAAQGLVPGSFDRSSITPGTQFMYDLHQKLLDFISKQKLKDLIWSTAQVIYSGVFVPGEGEHKIMNYIRENRASPEWNPNQVHCVYSTDADLLFLTLQTHEPYFVVLREIDAVFFKRESQIFEAKTSTVSWAEDAFEIVHLSLVREYLALDFNVEGEELELTIDDFIALSFLVGNDFIPFFNDIDISTGSYDDILNIYKMIRESSSYLIENGQFNKSVMKLFFQKIIELFHQRYKEKMDLSESIEEVAKICTEKNRQYLIEKYENPENLDELIKEMSFSILDAFDWVLKYYREGCPSWKWHYPYHYAPPLEFVIPYIDEHQSEFEEEFPNPPLLQLLTVLPPQSKNLLPKELQPLFDCEELKDFYPEKINTDQNGRKADWQATVLIPMIDIELLERKFNEIELPDDIMENLNKVEFPIEFVNGIEQEEINILKGEIPFQPENLSTERPVCIPTFEGFDFKFREEVVPVKLFEHHSSKPSFVIQVERDPQTAEEVKGLLDQKILINWPYLRPATVIGMMDEKNIYNASSKTFVPFTGKFPADKCHDDLMTTKALDLGQISVFLNVVAQNGDGTFESKKNRNVPINLMVPYDSRPEISHNFQPPPVREPDLNETVVFIGGFAESGVGSIVEKDEKGKYFKVNVHHRIYPPVKTIIKDDLRRWITFQDLVKSVGRITFKALRTCLSKVILQPSGINIALTLFTYEHKVIEGCCKRLPDDNSYVFASFIPFLVKEYFTYTGSLKTIIMDSYNRKEKELPKITLEMLYGGNADHQNECFERLINWLSENAPAVKFPLVPDNSNFLSKECLSKLESTINTFDFNVHDETVDSYDTSAILWRTKPNPKPLSDLPRIGQRVVSIASSGPAVFGEIGTVIETDPNGYVTVLFDNILTCGTRLEGRLSTNRGLRLRANEIIIVRGS